MDNRRMRSVGRDLIAGLVVFLVALPLCLGIAHASGAPLEAGLISGIVGGLVVGTLSGSHVSVSGPAAGLAAIVVAQIEHLGGFDAFLLAVVLAGAMQIGLGMLRAGGLARYFPNSVIKGLMVAIGVLLVLKQMPHLVGHDADYEGDLAFEQEDGDNTFSALRTALLRFLPGAAAVGLLSLGVLIVWERTRLKKLPVPSALAAVLVGTVTNALFVALGSPLAIAATHLVGVPDVGSAGTTWADLLRFPDLGRIFEPQILLAGMTLAVVASLETLLNLEATDKLDPLRRTAAPDRELVAQGVGNLIVGSLGGLPMTSVIVRSSVNANAGGRTRLATIWHGVYLLASVALFAPLINSIPLATLAAVLVFTGWKLANPRLWRALWHEGWNQFVPFATTVIAIVTTDLLVGVSIGLATSIVFVLWRNLRGGFRVFREEHAAGAVHRIELATQATFMNRAHLAAVLDGFKRDSQVVIDARNTDYVDPDLLAQIREYVAERAPARGVNVSTVGFKDRYALDDVIQYVDFTSRELQESLTPARVLQVLKDGNERFKSGRRLQRDLVRQVDLTSSGQHPMAVVLSCIDSRAPVELLFDLGIGDIFSVRVAGNVARDKVLGSMEFACKVAGAKLIVVLGHTRCGAVKATCDFVAQGTDPATAAGLTNLPAVTDLITDAVRGETRTELDRTGGNPKFVDRVARLHVLNTLGRVRQHSPTLAAMIERREIGIVGAMYDVSTGHVEFFERHADGAVTPADRGAAAQQPTDR